MKLFLLFSFFFFKANQCPLKGGNAVVHARNIIIHAYNDIIDFVDECDLIEPRSEKADQNISGSFSIKVYPNPTSGLCTFVLAEGFEGKLNICNAQGAIVFEKQLSLKENVYKIDLSALPSGLYCIKILKGVEVLKSDKLVITK